MKHTPTPWHIEDECFIRGTSRANENWDIAELHGPDASENAKHIVKCVNVYESSKQRIENLKTALMELLHDAEHGVLRNTSLLMAREAMQHHP